MHILFSIKDTETPSSSVKLYPSSTSSLVIIFFFSILIWIAFVISQPKTAIWTVRFHLANGLLECDLRGAAYTCNGAQVCSGVVSHQTNYQIRSASFKCLVLVVSRPTYNDGLLVTVNSQLSFHNVITCPFLKKPRQHISKLINNVTYIGYAIPYFF